MVYPRVGGGNNPSALANYHGDGLSPRGRGKPVVAQEPHGRAGSIPAWAGETLQCDAPRRPAQVYPRVGGGNIPMIPALLRHLGLSPRGRGKLVRLSTVSSHTRSIPAWAGETLVVEFAAAQGWVYPRVGGGNPDAVRRAFKRKGLSPRGRGKLLHATPHHGLMGSIPAWAGETWAGRPVSAATTVYPRVGGGNAMMSARESEYVGLSPRGRGKQPRREAFELKRGSIPAWAGETWPTIRIKPIVAVYPRVGGGNVRAHVRVVCRPGLSPRGRGKLSPLPLKDAVAGSIPAWAGETDTARHMFLEESVYPRVGGGNNMQTTEKLLRGGLSPRGRGKPSAVLTDGVQAGSIPAWAGETRACCAVSLSHSVYPRVGGGNYLQEQGKKVDMGLSPRGRGKPIPLRLGDATRGSIPAWAGETTRDCRR